jgi:hypothetical protein
MLLMIGSAENMKTDNEKLAELIGNGMFRLVNSRSLQFWRFPGATPNAIRQRVWKINNAAKKLVAGTFGDIEVTGGAKGGKATPKKSANGKSFASGGDGDDDEVTLTPSKKRAANGDGKGKGTPRAKKAKEDVKDEASPAKDMKTEDDVELGAEDDGYGEIWAIVISSKTLGDDMMVGLILAHFNSYERTPN